MLIDLGQTRIPSAPRTPKPRRTANRVTRLRTRLLDLDQIYSRSSKSDVDFGLAGRLGLLLLDQARTGASGLSRSSRILEIEYYGARRLQSSASRLGTAPRLRTWHQGVGRSRLVYSRSSKAPESGCLWLSSSRSCSARPGVLGQLLSRSSK